jgi:hypothetical protein
MDEGTVFLVEIRKGVLEVSVEEISRRLPHHLAGQCGTV